jgi:hypothetical protein
LADYFVNVCDVYFPTVPVTRHANLPWGDSDHTSFNQKGYKGIWWFEDINCDSPYIHHTAGSGGCSNGCTGSIPCLGDLIGPSVNNAQQVTVFTQAMVASIATLAELDGEMPPPIVPPTNCKAQAFEDMKIVVTWDAPVLNTPDEYNIYRDGEQHAQSETTSYTDLVDDYEKYCYTVTAIYGEIESVHSNEDCDAVPVPLPLAPPTNCKAQAFEDMKIVVTWDAPTGNTPDVYYIYRDDAKLTESETTSYSDIVEDYETYCYTITAVYGEDESDPSNEDCDAVKIGITEYTQKVKIYPNPATNELRIEICDIISEICDIVIYDTFGRKVLSSLTSHSSPFTSINISLLNPGVYFVKITNEVVGKFVKE